MYYNDDSLHHRLRPISLAAGRHWDPSENADEAELAEGQLTGSKAIAASGRTTSRARCCHNSTVLITLTILLTGLAAYLLTVIANVSPVRMSHSHVQNSPTAAAAVANSSSKASQVLAPDTTQAVEFEDEREESLQRPPRTLEPLSLMSSEVVATRVRPARELHTSENLARLRDKLAQLGRADLIKLLGLIQARIQARSLKKRHVQQQQQRQQHELIKSSDTLASVKQQQQQQELAAVGSVSKDQTQAAYTDKANATTGLVVVARSRRMEQLMGYLERIEASMPALNASALEQLAAADDERSIVRVLKPDALSSIIESNATTTTTTIAPIAAARSQRSAVSFGSAVSSPASWRREPLESVAPNGGNNWGHHQEEEEHQQPEVIEDWPEDQPSVTTSTTTTTQRPRKRKRKRIRTTTTTSTTTTSTTQAPETTSTPSPPAAFEEVWIEEEEDIVRPPKKKRKKYKKKTSPPPTSTTSTTTSTTTTTTRAPTTSTQAPVEDWPEEEEWHEDEQQPQTSTKAPSKLWPDQPQPQPHLGGQHHGSGQKWPEEEWLNALRDDIQSRLHIVYA